MNYVPAIFWSGSRNALLLNLYVISLIRKDVSNKKPGRVPQGFLLKGRVKFYAAKGPRIISGLLFVFEVFSVHQFLFANILTAAGMTFLRAACEPILPPIFSSAHSRTSCAFRYSYLGSGVHNSPHVYYDSLWMTARQIRKPGLGSGLTTSLAPLVFRL